MKFSRPKKRARKLGYAFGVTAIVSSLIAGPAHAVPATLAVTPDTQDVFVGATASVTATLTESGPVEGRSLVGTIEGANAWITPSCGSCTTDAQGKVTFQWSGGVGVDTITVYDDVDHSGTMDAGEASDTASVTWHPGLTVTSDILSASPGGSPVITARLEPPTQDARIRFQVASGPNAGAAFVCAPVTCITGESFSVDATYTSGPTAGTDVIVVYHDANNSNTRQATEAQKTLAIIWSAPKNILVYGPTGSPSGLAETTPNVTVTTWDASTWGSKTTAQFAAFDAIVFGDQPACGFGPEIYETAVANRSTWTGAIDGKAIILGTDPDFHDKTQLVHQSVLFAAGDAGKTGLYVALGCAYDTAGESSVEFLGGLGTFTAETSGCGNAAHKVSESPALAGIDDAYLSDWGCSTHNGFSAWPGSFQPLAMVTDAPTRPYTASDGTIGLVYMLSRGAEAVGLSLSPTSGSSAAGGSHTVTATYTDGDEPVSGARIRFLVTTGPNAGATGTCSPVTCLSNSSGVVGFTYTSGGVAGTDDIKAYVDLNNNNTHDPSEPQTTAAWTWTAANPDQANLSVTKTDSPDPVTVNGDVTYTITVNNAGPNAATGVTVVDTLPTNSTFVSAEPSVGTCGAPNSGTVTCDLGTVADGASPTVTVVVTATQVGEIVNAVSVSSSVNDPTPGNNSDSETTTVQAASGSADLSLTKTDSPDPVLAGQSLTYVITVTNNGAGDATNVTVTDALPTGVTFLAAYPSQGTCSGTATVTCALGELAAAEGSNTATIDILVTPNATGEISNTATVSATQSDPNSSNNSDTAVTTVYTLQPGVDRNPTIENTDFLSFGLGQLRDLGSGTINVSGVTGSVTKALLYWNGPTNSTDASANSAVTFNGFAVTGTQIGFSSDNCWGYTNSQSYRADVTSRVTGNGNYTVADLVKSSNSINVNGVSLLVFFNDGNAANNRDIVLFDGNDSNIDNTYDAQGWDVTLNGVTYTSGSASIQLHVSDGQQYDDDALILNTQTLVAAGPIFEGDGIQLSTGPVQPLWDIETFDITSFLTPGPTPNNLRLTTGLGGDCLSLVVAAVNLPAAGSAIDTSSANLGITKTKTAPTSPVAGSNLTYTITVSNTGPDAAAGVTVSDVISSKATFVSATPSVGSCSGTTTVSCSLGTLANGANATITLVVKPLEAGPLSNTATVSSTTSDPAAGNNTATALTTIAEPPPPILSIGDVVVTEGNSGSTNAVFTVSLSPEQSGSVSVDWASANDTAVAPGDFASAGGTLNFTAGQTSKTITIAVAGDTANEDDELFFVNLTAPTGASLADAHGVGTILNDDAVPSLSISDVTVAEGNTGTANAVFNVTLSAASGKTVRVDFLTSNGTATQPADYSLGSGLLTFAPGETSKQISIPVNGDLLDEVNETFTVVLAGPQNATISDASGTGTITDDDNQPTLAIQDDTSSEGTPLTFNVVLSAASGKTVTVNYATAGGTATSTTDFTESSGTLTFAPGDTSETVTVTTIEDLLDEADETMAVNLTGGFNATVTDAAAVGTIEDDDPTPSLSMSDVTVEEGNSGTVNAVFTVTLSAASGRQVTVDWATQNDTATQPGDYAAGDGTLTFSPGDVSEQITVIVNGDTEDEGNETFFVAFSDPLNALMPDAQSVGTILDDEGCPSSADFNGDGRCDLAVGVPGEDVGSVADAGAVNVLYGTASGLTSVGDQLWHQNTTTDAEPHELTDHVEPKDKFGTALAWGDFNNDGFSDLAVGVPGEDHSSKTDAGAIHILYGSASGLTGVGSQFLHQNSGTIPDTAETGDVFGTSLSVGWFNDDEFADLAVGSPGESVGTVAAAGAVHVLFGSAGGLKTTDAQLWHQNIGTIEDVAEASDRYGTRLATGDLNGDGFSDLAATVQAEDISGKIDTGAVSVLYGASAGLTDVGDDFWHQNAAGVPDSNEGSDNFGARVAIGDVTGDSKDDLAVAAPNEDLSGFSNAGAVTIFAGAADGLVATSQFLHQNSSLMPDVIESEDRFGSALATGDLSGDGKDDLAIGVPNENVGTIADAGMIHVMLGSATGPVANGSQRWWQDVRGVVDVSEAGDAFGGAISMGNFNGDGRQDLAVGIAGEDVSGVSNAGAVAVFGGAAAGLTGTGNSIWHQNTGGVLSVAETSDGFGAWLAG